MPAEQPVDKLRRGLLQEAKLLAADRNSTEYFGLTTAISADGNTAIIGAYLDDDATGMETVDSGAAYIFTRTDSTWTQQAKLIADDKAAGDRFGTSVAISSDGNTVLIGSAGSDDTSQLLNCGAAYVFTRSGATWMQEAKLQVQDRGADDGLGTWAALSYDGNTALVSASAHDEETTGTTNNGAAYVFARNAGSWREDAKLLASMPQTDALFGSAVAISGDGNTALISAASEDDQAGMLTNSGAGYVFVRNGAMWEEQQKLLAIDRGDSDFFGRNVALSADGNALFITAQVQDDESTGNFDNGTAYYFTRSGTEWTQTQQLLSPDKADNDRFGTGVSLSADGQTVLIGARFDDDLSEINPATDNGSAYVFKQTANGWLFQGKLVANDRAKDDWGGYHVSLSADGKTALVGAYGEDDEATGIVDNGAAYVYLLGDALGVSCTTDVQCISGHCADGVCCTSACGGSDPSDCQACTAATKQSGKDDGICGAAKSTVVCRGSAGICDQVETCDGTAMDCPADIKRQSGFVCRVSGGPCDIAETCDGSTNFCPKLDAVKAVGIQCKAPGISQICDPADVCDGRSKLCPMRYGAPGMSCGGGKVCRLNGICS